MQLTAMFDKLFNVVGYCPSCFADGVESKVYQPKADRGEWIGKQYITYKDEHFSGTCAECGWNTKQGDPISVEEMQVMRNGPETSPLEIPADAPF